MRVTFDRGVTPSVSAPGKPENCLSVVGIEPATFGLPV